MIILGLFRQHVTAAATDTDSSRVLNYEGKNPKHNDRIRGDIVGNHRGMMQFTRNSPPHACRLRIKERLLIELDALDVN